MAVLQLLPLLPLARHFLRRCSRRARSSSIYLQIRQMANFAEARESCVLFSLEQRLLVRLSTLDKPVRQSACAHLLLNYNMLS
jgi:hypothetical protein